MEFLGRASHRLRAVGEYALPRGTWVVAAGNRLQDRALVRAMSSALVNRVTILQLRVDTAEWLSWAQRAGIRNEIRSFIATIPDALMRPVPAEPVPFSTPRAWALLSRAFDMAQKCGLLSNETRRALAFGRLSTAAQRAALAVGVVITDPNRDGDIIPQQKERMCDHDEDSQFCSRRARPTRDVAV